MDRQLSTIKRVMCNLYRFFFFGEISGIYLKLNIEMVIMLRKRKGFIMKRIIALIMVMIMGMSLCACAGDVKSDVPGNVVNEVGADKNVETLPHTEEPTETPAETPTEAPAAAGADLSDVLLSVSIDSYSKDQLQGSETIDVEYDAQGNQTVCAGQYAKHVITYQYGAY